MSGKRTKQPQAREHVMMTKPGWLALIVSVMSGCGADAAEEEVTETSISCGGIIPATAYYGYLGPRSVYGTNTYAQPVTCPTRNATSYVDGAYRAIEDEYWAGYSSAVGSAAIIANCPQSCPAEVTLIMHDPDGAEQVPSSDVTAYGTFTGIGLGYQCLYTADFAVHPVLRVECKIPPASGSGK
jgi:hypothetical protein